MFFLWILLPIPVLTGMHVICYSGFLGHSLLNRDEYLTQSQWYSFFKKFGLGLNLLLKPRTHKFKHRWYHHLPCAGRNKGSWYSEWEEQIYIRKQGRDGEVAQVRAERKVMQLPWFPAVFLFLTLDHCCAWIFSLLILCEKYSWPLNNMGLICTVPFIHRFFYKYSYSKCLFLVIFSVTFSPAYFTERMWYITHIQNVCPLIVNGNSRFLVQLAFCIHCFRSEGANLRDKKGSS